MTDLDDIYYVKLVKAGDYNAFAHIVRRYQKMLFSIVCKIVPNEADAEDITQEVFIKVFKSLDRFREESKFSTWLYQVAYNTAISEVRKKKKEFLSTDDHLANVPDEDIADTVDEISTEEQLTMLDEVINKLPPDDAMLISLYYLDNQSMQDIAQITSLSVSNVKVKLFRIRKIMNFELNKLISR